jgi:hypothetical protein
MATTSRTKQVPHNWLALCVRGLDLAHEVYRAIDRHYVVPPLTIGMYTQESGKQYFYIAPASTQEHAQTSDIRSFVAGYMAANQA